MKSSSQMLLCSNPPICLKNTLNPLAVRAKPPHRHKSSLSCTRVDHDSSQPISTVHHQQQQLNLSVLRFTLGIPGLDESYLPRWIGYALGSLLVLNHFLGSVSATSPQLRTEALGLSLAGFSVVLPYLGQFLNGATPVYQATTSLGAEQIFVMSQNITDNLKEDLAWGTYVLLRNTNSISVLFLIEGALCARGYWNTPGNISKNDTLDWFKTQIQRIGLSNIKDPLYFPQSEDSELWKMLPSGTCSLLIQPVEKDRGFVLLASNINSAYSERDTAWIGAILKKFNRLFCDTNPSIKL